MKYSILINSCQLWKWWQVSKKKMQNNNKKRVSVFGVDVSRPRRSAVHLEAWKLACLIPAACLTAWQPTLHFNRDHTIITLLDGCFPLLFFSVNAWVGKRHLIKCASPSRIFKMIIPRLYSGIFLIKPAWARARARAHTQSILYILFKLSLKQNVCQIFIWNVAGLLHSPLSVYLLLFWNICI